MSHACRMLRISRQAVYQYAGRRHSRCVEESKIIHQVCLTRHIMPRLGTRKLYARLQSMLSPLGIGRDRLFEMLKSHRLLVRPRKRFTPTTNSGHALPVRPNLLKLTKPSGPGRVIVADQTYLRLEHGFCYLSLVSDLYSRKIIGVDVSPTLETAGPLRALAMAFKSITRHNWFIHHSDRGVQYCSNEYRAFVESRGGQSSMSAPGCPYDNAVAERINGILKSEFYLDRVFTSIHHAYEAAEEAVSIYNTERPHLSLGMMTPEMRYAA
ncbi:MAG: IS3 family transposase [Bacteroidota bacterium]